LIHTVQFGQLKTRLLQWKQENQPNLLEGMWIIATYQYPDYEFKQLKADIEQLYHTAWVEMKNADEATSYEKVRILNGIFFDKFKFVSNTKNFHSVSNSMINQVLDTRKGNPISLCIVYMTIAQKLNLPVFGVNLPNLFILTYKENETQFYINAFNKGLIFSREDIDNYVSHLNLASNKLFYEPCNNLDIIRRVLRNMLISYEKATDEDRANEVKQLIELINDESDNGFLIN
jgi:regulator of sirC expression with transglutaminase-like and TPR domain